MKLILIGASGTFGGSLFNEASSRGFDVISVSRTNTGREFVYCDLTNLERIPGALKNVGGIGQDSIAFVNSGILGPIGLGAEVDFSQFISAVNVNALSNLSLFQELFGKGVRKYVITSSGAALKNYSGWFAYCQSKSLQKNIWQSLCHDHVDISVRLLAPGVIGSRMHDFTNGVPKRKYPELTKFFEIKESNVYQDSDVAARKTFDLIGDPEFFRPGFKFIDLREIE